MKYYQYTKFEFLDNGFSTSVEARASEFATIYADVCVVAVSKDYAAYVKEQDARINLSEITKTKALELLKTSEVYQCEQNALANAKEYFLKAVNEQFEVAINKLHDNTPSSEIASWTIQENEAREYKLDNTKETIMLNQIATTRNIPLNILVDKVIAKADAFRALSAALIAKRQKYEDECKAALSLDELQKIIVEF